MVDVYVLAEENAGKNSIINYTSTLWPFAFPQKRTHNINVLVFGDYHKLNESVVPSSAEETWACTHSLKVVQGFVKFSLSSISRETVLADDELWIDQLDAFNRKFS